MTKTTSLSVRIDHPGELAAGLKELGLGGGRPTLVLVGGAGGLRDDGALSQFALEKVARCIEAAGGCVVDGGTDAGVMHLMGCARTAAGATFPLVGVAAEQTLAGSVPESPGTITAPPEPHHSHFLIVPGSSWGDESPWISRVATALAGDSPSVTLLIGGGEVSWTDIAESVAAGRHIVALAGTGGAADALAQALKGAPGDQRARSLAGSGLVEAIAAEEPDRVEERIAEALGTGS